MDGLLLVDKPKQWTSHDVVAKLRGVLSADLRRSDDGRKNSKQTLKVGHAGTLDPMATGLLLILIGSATKQQEKFMKLDKSYRATIVLGAYSDTDDAEGKIIPQQPTDADARMLSEADIKAVLDKFEGEIEQVPPQYSAIKVGGQRAYRAARAGKAMKLDSRRVNVYSLDMDSFDYPYLELYCHVGSGTYIRSLARDIGEATGLGGYLGDLRRISIGQWRIEEALGPNSDIESIKKNIIPLRNMP